MVSSIGLQFLNLLISFFLYYLSLMDLLFYHGWQVHLHWIGKFKVFKHICSCFIFFPLEAIEWRNVAKLRLLTLFTALVIVIIHGEMNCKAILVPFLVQELLLFVVMVLLSMLLLSLDFINEPCFTMLLFMSIVEHYFSWVLLKCCYSLTWTLWRAKVAMQQPSDGR